MEPEVSIIVPVYNVERFLHKCVNSILTQTFRDFELILVDDGSPDRCGDICDHYARQDMRVRVIHKENGGLSSARNSGIKIAKGKYIGFVDSDDYIHENMYAILYENAVMHSSDLVVCDYLKVQVSTYHHSTKALDATADFNVQHFTNIEALYQFYENKQVTPTKALSGFGTKVRWIIACNKLYKKSLFQHIEFNEGRIFEDEFIMHKIIYHSARITLVPQKLYYYVQRPDSILGSPFTLKKFDKVYALQERADFFKRIKQRQLYHLALINFMDTFLWFYHRAESELIHANKELKELKRMLDTRLITLIRNPLLGSKQKLMMVVFCINPYVYHRLKNKLW